MKYLGKIQAEFLKIAGRALNLRSVVGLPSGEVGYTEMPLTSFPHLSDTATVEVWFPSNKNKRSITFLPKKFIKTAVTPIKEYDNKEVMDDIKGSRFRHPKFEKLFQNHVLDIIGEGSKPVYELLQDLTYRRWRLRHDIVPDLKEMGFVVDDNNRVSRGSAVWQLGVKDDWLTALARESQLQYLKNHPHSKMQVTNSTDTKTQETV
jgi:hypothetical protein